MKNYFLLFAMLLAVLVSCRKAEVDGAEQSVTTKEEPRGADNIAYKWSEMAILGTAKDTDRFKPRPTVTSRILALTWTSIFDAWSRYDDKASPVYLVNVERQPAAERTALFTVRACRGHGARDPRYLLGRRVRGI